MFSVVSINNSSASSKC